VKASQERILEVAERLFAERGYANVSIRDVCRGAATTAPMIYYYFGNKEGLFKAAVSHKVSMSDFIDRLNKTTDVKDEEEAISAFIETYLSSFPDHAFDIGYYVADQAKLDRRSAEKISRDLDEIHAIASSVIQRGIRSGRFIQTDPGLAADCLIGMLNRVVFQRIHFEKSRDTASYALFIRDFLLRALR
jgi:AcrR family transcriptional regulator